MIKHLIRSTYKLPIKGGAWWFVFSGPDNVKLLLYGQNKTKVSQRYKFRVLSSHLDLMDIKQVCHQSKYIKFRFVYWKTTKFNICRHFTCETFLPVTYLHLWLPCYLSAFLVAGDWYRIPPLCPPRPLLPPTPRVNPPPLDPNVCSVRVYSTMRYMYIG